MSFSPLVSQLIDSLCCIPGVGPKSAQRIALHLLERGRDDGLKLASILNTALKEVAHCRLCRNYTEQDVCDLCQNVSRKVDSLCIVETPSDIIAIEQAGVFAGRYFVLMGRLSPIDGIGPEQLGLNLLFDRVQDESITEVILATNPTVEGEATAHYIAEQLKLLNVEVFRIAHGVPIGGELEYVDSGTLSHAFLGRKPFS